MASTKWMDGYGVVPRHVEVLEKLPPDASINRHLLHGFLLCCIREYRMPIK
jgi:hypothetical protein